MPPDRINNIQQHLYSNGFANVQDLAQATGAPTVTIRRDWQRLEKAGMVTNTHGSARLAGSVGPEVAFQRMQEYLEAARAIADAAYGLLRPHTAVFLDTSGSPCCDWPPIRRRIRTGPG